MAFASKLTICRQRVRTTDDAEMSSLISWNESYEELGMHEDYGRMSGCRTARLALDVWGGMAVYCLPSSTIEQS